MSAPPGAEAGSQGAFGRRPSTGVAASARAVAEDASALVRAELALARAELAQGVRAKALGAGLLAGAGALAVVAALTLLLALGFALAEVGGLPGWASALIVAAALVAVAVALAALGRRHLAAAVTLDTTAQRVKEDVEWARRSIRRT